MFRVIVSDERGETTTVPSDGDEVTIGRAQNNTVWLNERNISRKHARVRLKNSRLIVENLDSYTGVRINGRSISSSGEIQEGDKIQIGDFVLTIQLDTENASVADLASRTQRISLQPSTDTVKTVVVETPKGLLSPKLVFLSGPLRGREFLISRPVTRLGRDNEHVDIAIQHKSISRDHAEIVLEENACRIRDLGSSNGLKVNQQTCVESALRSGDLIELGIIKARLVGVDDPYRIEMDPAFERTSSRPSVAVGKRERKTGVYFTLGAVVVLGAIGVTVGGIMRSQDQPDTRPDPLPRIENKPVTQAAPTGTFEKELEQCQTAFSSSRYAEAVHHGTLALQLREGDADAQQCDRAARAALAEERAYEKGLEAMQRGATDEAFLIFDKLPPSSIYRSKPQVIETAGQYAKGRLSKIQATLQTEPEDARNGLNALLSSKLIPKAYVLQARRLLVQLNPRPARPTFSGTSNAASRNGAAPSPTNVSPFDAAKICLAQGDQRCAIVSLEGKARSARELGLLVETYRAVGDTMNALRTMNDFVTNYPNDPRSVSYRQFLQQHER